MNGLLIEPDIEDMDEIMKSGERLPPEMWEPDMPETTLNSPVFNGIEVVESGRGEE